jgi:hypothetical protein
MPSFKHFRREAGDFSLSWASKSSWLNLSAPSVAPLIAYVCSVSDEPAPPPCRSRHHQCPTVHHPGYSPLPPPHGPRSPTSLPTRRRGPEVPWPSSGARRKPRRLGLPPPGYYDRPGHFFNFWGGGKVRSRAAHFFLGPHNGTL